MYDEDKLLNASMQDMRRGYSEDPDFYECLLCGKKIEKGIVWQQDEFFYEAEKFMDIHIKKTHVSVFDFLISLDKKITGLSDHQNKLLRLFHEGKSDVEIQKAIGVGSSSTVRNHRFALKERERQAKVFLTLMDILKSGKKSPALVVPHKTAVMVDDRYSVTDDENETILENYFYKGLDGPLKTFSMKEKHKVAVIRQLIKRFEPDRFYTEKEVNEILKGAYEDFATIRRYLIEYGLLERKPNGSRYWVKKADKQDQGINGQNPSSAGRPQSKVNDRKDGDMDRRKELLDQYKQMKKDAGIYQIRNMIDNKIYVIMTQNLKNMNGKRFELLMGSLKNAELQKDWNRLGENAFAFEVLEVLEEKDDGFFDKKEELRKLERKWLDKLQPYGDKGYNIKKPE
jgi:hypothetical protein